MHTLQFLIREYQRPTALHCTLRRELRVSPTHVHTHTLVISSTSTHSSVVVLGIRSTAIIIFVILCDYNKRHPVLPFQKEREPEMSSGRTNMLARPVFLKRLVAKIIRALALYECNIHYTMSLITDDECHNDGVKSEGRGRVGAGYVLSERKEHPQTAYCTQIIGWNSIKNDQRKAANLGDFSPTNNPFSEPAWVTLYLDIPI